MIVHRLKGNSPSLLVLMLFLAIAFRFPFHPCLFGVQTVFTDWIILHIAKNQLFSISIAVILILLQAFYINKLNFKYIFYEGQSYLPSLVFVIFWGVWVDFSGFHPVMLANFFLLAALDKYFIISKDLFIPSNYFEGMFFLAVGSLFYPLLVVFFPLLLMVQLMLRTFNWREWAVALAGFLLPFVAFYLICFVFDFTIVYSHFVYPFIEIKQQIAYSVYLWAAAPIAIMVLWGLGFLFSVLGTRKISTRKYYNAFFLHLVFGVVVYLVWFSTNHDFLMLLGFPVSMVLAIWMAGVRSKFWANMAFVLFCVCIVLLRYATQMF